MNAKSYGITTDAGIGQLIKNYKAWAGTKLIFKTTTLRNNTGYNVN